MSCTALLPIPGPPVTTTQRRGRSKLSLADVADRLGKSRNTYATYERGEREPSLSQFRELLAAVAPDMALMVGPLALATARRP